MPGASGEDLGSATAAVDNNSAGRISAAAIASQRRLEFLPRLESVRGLAAVSVVWYHVAGQYLNTIVTGMAPVVMFFVLSGFVLARSLHNDPTPVDFVRHRIFRLLPAAASTVLLLTALYYRYGFYVGNLGAFDPLNVVLNALMIKSDINGIMWSMTVECFATPLIFIADWMCKRGQVGPLIALIIVLFGLSFIGPYVHLLGGFTDLAPLYAFAIGVLLHHRGRAFAAKLTLPTSRILTLAAFALFVVCGLRKQNPIVIMLECTGASVLLLMISTRTDIHAFRLLDAPIVRFYGRISYSFYLLHMIGFAVALRILNVEGLSPVAATVVIALAAIVLTSAMAWPSWSLIESPFIALGRRFDRTRAGLARLRASG